MRAAQPVCRLVRGFYMSPAVRRAASTDVHPGYKSIKPKQERYLVDDGVPIHLKGGAFDAMLYRLTMGLCILAVGWDVKLYYDLSKK